MDGNCRENAKSRIPRSQYPFNKLNLPMVLPKAEATRKSGIKDDRVLAFVLFICFVRPPSTLEIPRPQSFQVFCAKFVDRRGAQTIETS